MKFSTILAAPFLFAGLPGVAMAQAPQVQPLQMVPRPTPDADALAAAMRRLGANSRDLSALIEAGELSLKLGDATAAASLFKRAEQIDPMNGRVKAGMARILVQQERPGEALRFFDQAAGYGLDARNFAGDRGLAYDLIGEQTRAQRDYQVALAAGPQDEVQRRYALSLAISGKKDEALAQIDPLVRKSDRGAWRTRAFILAMGGDLPGATDIATRMMPPGMATGLQPFFKTLPSLGPVDRAFAVHFGEIRATPARVADARLAPALPVLPPEPAAAPVTLAQAAAPVLRAAVKKREARERRQSARDRRREKQQRVQVARARPAGVPLPDAPRYGSVNGVTFAAPREVAQSVPARRTPPPIAAAAQVAVATPKSAPVAPVQATSAATSTARSAVPTAPATTATAPVSVASSASNKGPATAIAVKPQSIVVTTQPAPGSTTASSAQASTRPPTIPASTTSSAPQTAATSTPTVTALASARTPTPSFSAAIPAATPPPSSAATSTTAASVPTNGAPVAPATATATPPAQAVAATSAPVAPQMSEDSILARIIAGISIPAEELGAAPTRPAPMAAAPAPAQSPPVASAPVRVASVAPAVRPPAPVAKPVVAKPVPIPTPKPTPKPTPTVDPKVAARKAAADKKAAEAKKLADLEKAAAAKKLADEKKAAKADPARIWVQVAGGANAGDLAKAWGAAKGKAAALGGKTPYSTPLRATNRVVTGPFKTDAEAQALVNTLAKQGVSAFTFTSEVGQKVTRLPLK